VYFILGFVGCASIQAALDYELPQTDTALSSTGVQTNETSIPQTTAEQDGYGTILASVPLVGAEDVVIVGDVAYVAAGELGLYVVDIFDASYPFVLRELDVSSAWRLHVEKDQLLVSARSDGLYIIDLSVASDPQVTVHFDPTWDIYDGVSFGEDMVVVGGVPGDGRVAILSQNESAGVDTVSSTNGAEQAGRTIVVKDDYAYVGQTEGYMTILDLLDPKSIQISGQIVPEASLTIQESLMNMRFIDDLLFAAAGEQGLRVFDVADPARAELVATNEEQPILDFVPFEERLVVVGGNGIGLVDVSEPKKPVSIESQVNLTLLNGSEPRAIAMDNGIAYVADHGESALSLVTIQGE
jgi:hypothetical protein